MESQMFPWKRTNLRTGEEEISMVQGAYRDLGFCVEYVFPKEQLKEVLEMMGIDPKKRGSDPKVSDLKKWIVRRALGNGVKKLPKKIPEPEWRMGFFKQEGEKILTSPYRYVETRAVMIHVLGIKEDKIKKSEKLGYKQEML